MKSYSQLGEDIYCFQNFINIPREDVVLFEIGAYDGLVYSNTLALEEFNQCRCVLVEPSPANVRKIYANRPHASIHRLAVSSGFGVHNFMGDSPISALETEVTNEYIETWKLKDAARYSVLSVPLNVIVMVEAVNYIDFISIDVQGAEFYVLNSMDWQIPIGTICVELEGQRPEYDEACRRLLERLGYIFKCRLLISEFWVKPDYHRSRLLFDPDRKMPFESFECPFLPRDCKKS